VEVIRIATYPVSNVHSMVLTQPRSVVHKQPSHIVLEYMPWQGLVPRAAEQLFHRRRLRRSDCVTAASKCPLNGVTMNTISTTSSEEGHDLAMEKGVELGVEV